MELEGYISILSEVPIFKKYTGENLLEFFRALKYKLVFYSKGSVIFLENDKCEALSIVLDGIIQVQKIDSYGRLLTIAEFQKGETFGENLLFGSGNYYPMTAVARTNSVILRIPKEAVLQLCLKDTDFLTEFLRLLSDKALTLSGRLKQVTLKTIRQKICELIYEEYISQKELVINLQMSRKEWADRLGVQRPSLSRELIRMKKEGIISYDRCNIYIKDIDSIQKYL